MDYPLAYWRTNSGIEVDFVLGDHETAIEVKSPNNANPCHLRGLKSFADEYNVKQLILVSNDPYPRKIDNITVLPWRTFQEQLWAGDVV